MSTHYLCFEQKQEKYKNFLSEKVQFLELNFFMYLNRRVLVMIAKPAKWMCAQRRLRSAWASAKSDQSSLCAQLVAKDPGFLHADNGDSDQTGRMPRLF